MLGELQMKHAVSNQLGIPVSPASRALVASLSKRVGLPVGGQAQPPKTSEQDLEFLRGRASQPLPGSSAEFPISEATFASNPMAAPNPSVSLGDPASEYFSAEPRPTAQPASAIGASTTQPTSAIGGLPISPTLNAYYKGVRDNALAKIYGIPHLPPIKPATTTLYHKDSGSPLKVAQADAQQIIDTGKWLTYNPAEGRAKHSQNVKLASHKSRLEEAQTVMARLDKGADSANNLLSDLTTMEQGLDAYKSPGTGQQVINTLRGFLDLAGIKVDQGKLASGQTVLGLQNQLAMKLRGDPEGGLPGATSNRDLEFLIESIPNLVKKAGANKVLLMGMKAAARRKIELRNLAAELREKSDGALTPKDLRKLAEFSSKDILTPDQRKEIKRLLNSPDDPAFANASKNQGSPVSGGGYVKGGFNVSGGGYIRPVND